MRNASRHKDQVEDRLRSERPLRPLLKAPDGFTESVISRLPAQPIRESSRPVAFFPRFAFGLATVGLGALLAFQFLSGGPEPAPVGVAANNLAPAPVEPLNINLPEITTEQVQALTLRLDQPLEKELENVISDTRQAIQFVASNFLPEK